MKAFHKVQGQDLRNPVNILGNYDLLVCNAGLEAEAIRERTKDSAVLLAGVNCRQVPRYGTAVGGFYELLRADMDDDTYYRIGADGGRQPGVKGGGGTYNTWELNPWNLDGAVTYAQSIADLLGDWPAGAGGLYLDDCTWGIPPWRLEALGIPNTLLWVEQVVARAWLRVFLKTLRTLVPAPFMLVANTWGGSRFRLEELAGVMGGESELPCELLQLLDGVTVEQPDVRDFHLFMDMAERRGSRDDLSRTCNVAWECAMQLPGVVMPGDNFKRK